MALAADRGGHGDALLVLLHGLGATRRVWSGLLPCVQGAWRGRWLAPDLPGHGESGPSASYGLGRVAAAVAGAIEVETPGRRLVILGHSYGAAVALALASGWFGVKPEAVFGLGLKTLWSEGEVCGLAVRAARPPVVLQGRDEAIALYLRVAGLAGLVSPSTTVAASGVRPAPTGWSLAMDPAANGVEPPPMAALAAAATARVRLACGSEDALADLEDLRRWDPQAQSLAGLGHNAMLEAPDAVWAWVHGALGARS